MKIKKINLFFLTTFVLSALTLGVSCSSSTAGSDDELIASTIPDFRASVPPNDTYDKDAFVEFDDRDFDVEGFEAYGYIHPSGSQTPWLGQDCGIPRSDTLQPAIRRWTSKFAGTIKIVGSVGMDTEHQTLTGNGTRVTMYVDGVQKYTKDLDGDSDTQYSFTKDDIKIEDGSVVDFVVEAIDANSIIANFTAKIYILSEDD